METLTKLLNAIIDFAKKFTELTGIGQFITIVILIFSTYYITSCTQKDTIDGFSVTIEETREQNKILKDSVTSLSDSTKKIEITVKKLRIEMSKLSTKRVSLKSSQTRLEKEIEQAPDTVTLVALQDTVIDNLKEQITVADVQIEKQEEIIETQSTQINLTRQALSVSEQRAALLESTLDKAIDKLNKKDKAWGIIPLPNRKVVAATALIGGVYLGTQLKR